MWTVLATKIVFLIDFTPEDMFLCNGDEISHVELANYTFITQRPCSKKQRVSKAWVFFESSSSPSGGALWDIISEKNMLGNEWQEPNVFLVPFELSHIGCLSI